MQGHSQSLLPSAEGKQKKELIQVNRRQWAKLLIALSNAQSNIEFVMAQCIGYSRQKEMNNEDMHATFEFINQYMLNTAATAAEKTHVSSSVHLFFNERDQTENHRFIRQNNTLIKMMIEEGRIDAVPGYHGDDITIQDYREKDKEGWEKMRSDLDAFIASKSTIQEALTAEVLKFIARRTDMEHTDIEDVDGAAALNMYKDEIVFLLMQMAPLPEEGKEKEVNAKQSKKFLLHDGPTPKTMKTILSFARYLGRDSDSLVFLIFNYDYPKKKAARNRPQFDHQPLATDSDETYTSDESRTSSSDDDSEEEIIVDVNPDEFNAKVKAGMEGQTKKFVEELVYLGFNAADLGTATSHFVFTSQMKQIQLYLFLQQLQLQNQLSQFPQQQMTLSNKGESSSFFAATQQASQHKGGDYPSSQVSQDAAPKVELRLNTQCFSGLFAGGSSSTKLKQQATATGSSTSPTDSCDVVPVRRPSGVVAVSAGK